MEKHICAKIKFEIQFFFYILFIYDTPVIIQFLRKQRNINCLHVVRKNVVYLIRISNHFTIIDQPWYKIFQSDYSIFSVNFLIPIFKQNLISLLRFIVIFFSYYYPNKSLINAHKKVARFIMFHYTYKHYQVIYVM